LCSRTSTPRAYSWCTRVLAQPRLEGQQPGNSLLHRGCATAAGSLRGGAPTPPGNAASSAYCAARQGAASSTRFDTTPTTGSTLFARPEMPAVPAGHEMVAQLHWRRGGCTGRGRCRPPTANVVAADTRWPDQIGVVETSRPSRERDPGGGPGKPRVTSPRRNGRPACGVNDRAGYEQAGSARPWPTG